MNFCVIDRPISLSTFLTYKSRWERLYSKQYEGALELEESDDLVVTIEYPIMSFYRKNQSVYSPFSFYAI
jgi:hypothetical protein